MAEDLTSAAKYLLVPFYAIWTLRIAVIDSTMNPLFALIIVLLSTCGLWIVTRKASKYLVRIIEGVGEADAVPKG